MKNSRLFADVLYGRPLIETEGSRIRGICRTCGPKTNCANLILVKRYIHIFRCILSGISVGIVSDFH